MSPYANKNVLVMGLGVHGGGLGVARFMGRSGANVRVTDLRTADVMRESIEALGRESFPVEYTLGEHREEDFRWADVVVRNQAVPPTSPWVALARQLGKAVETEINIFMRLCPGPIVGVTGTKGKSSTATWTWEMLRHWRADAVLAGNLRVSALEALERITPETPVVLELSSFQTEGFEEPRISPHLAAVTNLSPDHLDRYKSMEEYGAAKKHIFLYQQPERGDCAVLNSADPVVAGWAADAPAGVAWFGIGAATRLPGVYVQDGVFYWYAEGRERALVGEASDLQVPGAHNLANAACAATLSLLAGATLEAVREGLRSFRGVADRQELVRTLRGVRYYNDTTSTTPASTIAALNAIEGPIVLIAGGAAKGLDFAELAPVVTSETVAVVLLEGTATDLMESQFREVGANILGRYSDFAEAMRVAMSAAPEGGAVLL
ncbi:MAG: UDP-N-acetylmuramoyl-L-alanine--D-glutamate ligase, partial [Chloroflexota bacterium]|nr:UDP-N-acetylmuramoyl-L-alanine--D-glutamate ligase [Chloroflexota bacterium]